MKIISVLVLLFLSASTVSAESKNALAYVSEQDNARQAAVSLVQKADYLGMTVTITSDEKEPVDQVQELLAAKQAIAVEAKKRPQIKMHTGPIYVSTDSKSSMSKIASYGGSSTSVIHLLYSLADKNDVLPAARDLMSLAKNLKAPGKASYRFSPVRLVVDSPEKYRSKLLQMIFEDLKQARTFAKLPAKITITGLENPVLVRQTDDMHAELYMNYSVSMEVLPGQAGK